MPANPIPIARIRRQPMLSEKTGQRPERHGERQHLPNRCHIRQRHMHQGRQEKEGRGQLCSGSARRLSHLSCLRKIQVKRTQMTGKKVYNRVARTPPAKQPIETGAYPATDKLHQRVIDGKCRHAAHHQQRAFYIWRHSDPVRFLEFQTYVDAMSTHGKSEVLGPRSDVVSERSRRSGLWKNTL